MAYAKNAFHLPPCIPKCFLPAQAIAGRLALLQASAYIYAQKSRSHARSQIRHMFL